MLVRHHVFHTYYARHIYCCSDAISKSCLYICIFTVALTSVRHHVLSYICTFTVAVTLVRHHVLIPMYVTFTVTVTLVQHYVFISMHVTFNVAVTFVRHHLFIPMYVTFTVAMALVRHHVFHTYARHIYCCCDLRSTSCFSHLCISHLLLLNGLVADFCSNYVVPLLIPCFSKCTGFSLIQIQ